MTLEQTQFLLNTVLKVLPNMDKRHMRDLLTILNNVMQSRKCRNVFVNAVDMRRDIRDVVQNLQSKTEKSDVIFSSKTIKRLFEILGDYNYFPVCMGCGKIIKIDTRNKTMGGNADRNEEFTWDHIYPKALGGTNEMTNLQPMHKKCNSDKNDNVVLQIHYEITIEVYMPGSQEDEISDCQTRYRNVKNRMCQFKGGKRHR